ncbi:MAG: RNA 2',3'-cyclic phosphodiesterase [Guyparkeria sp.]
MPEETEPPDQGRQHRVFIALWPEAAVRDQLVRVARRLPGGGRMVPPGHLHLTLAFPGNVPTDRVDCLVAGLDRLRTRPIPLVLDRVGHFSGARVAWIGPSRVPAALQQLAGAAHQLCADCDIEIEGRRFVPHVTLRRGATVPAARHFHPVPVRWCTNSVALIESGDNGRPGPYRVVARVGRFAR